MRGRMVTKIVDRCRHTVTAVGARCRAFPSTFGSDHETSRRALATSCGIGLPQRPGDMWGGESRRAG